VATRRIWSASDRQRIVGEAAVPGVNVSAVARRNGVAQSLLYRWRKEAAAA
jgi:transposase